MKPWETFLDEQEKLIGKENTDRWLRSLKIVRFDARNLYLEAKDTFHIHWFEQHVRKAAKKLKNGNGRAVHIHLSSGQRSSQANKLPRKSRINEACFQSDRLIKSSRFDSFYISEENRLTCGVLQKLHTSLTYNPIFIYAPKGCGKTHLLMSVAQALQSFSLKTSYIRAETFTSHVVRAIQFANMQQFRQIYRSIDALIFDDVHILAGKNATQEEFFHTFNALHTAEKRIVISSPVPPQELVDIEPRLISRFEWGICLGLEPPKKDDLKEILRLKARAMHFPLSEKNTRFLLDSFHSLPSLYTAFDALVLRNPSKDAPLETILSDLLEKEQMSMITPERIVQKTAEILEVSEADILGKSQQSRASLGRKIAIYLMRKKLKFSFTKIGKIFQRDHSTIMSAVKNVEKNPPDALINVQAGLR